MLILSLIVISVSVLYRAFYKYSRKYPGNPFSFSSQDILLLGLCLVYTFSLNYLLLKRMTPLFLFSRSTMILFLLEVIANIDILLRKIPTELLVLLLLLIVKTYVYYPKEMIISAIIFGAVSWIWFLFAKKIGIALYDVIYISLLGAVINNIVIFLRFHALILVYWGLTGFILMKVLKKSKSEKIPLAPIITAAFFTAYSIAFI